MSSPTDDLSAANLQPLTLYNAIQDLTYFANNVDLPWATKDHPGNAKDVPWVLLGGSYSGALTAWTESTAPGTFWAYYASSAVVEAISDFWEYFSPVQQNMPQNCSRDVSAVIDYMDDTIKTGNKQAIDELKRNFGLTNVTHNDDFMAVLENGPWLWQRYDLRGGTFPFVLLTLSRVSASSCIPVTPGSLSSATRSKECTTTLVRPSRMPTESALTML